MLSIPGLSYTKKVESTFFSKYGALLDIALRVIDVAVVVAVAYGVYWLRYDGLALRDPYGLGLVRAVLLTLLLFPAAGVYRSWRSESRVSEIVRLWFAWSAVIAVLLLLEWSFKSTGQYSRINAAAWFAISGIVLSLNRMAIRWLLGHIRARGVDSRRIVLVGATQSGQRILAAVRKNAWMGLDVVGYVNTPHDQVDIVGPPCLGELDTFLENIDSLAVDQVWIALPMRAESTIQRVLLATLDTPLTIRFVPDFFGYELINHHVTGVGGVPVITLRSSRVEGHARIAKAIFDRAFALIAITLLSPLLLLLAIGVKLSSSGPIIFKQKRHGLGGKEFEVWKFRTMRTHSEQAGAVTQAKRGDSRITGFGQFLRRTSLDELPQFFNVLTGDMSVVGPRPHAIAHNNHYKRLVQAYMQRHQSKPGITGWAQVNGFRGETDTIEKMAGRVNYDIYYLKNWSLWFDVRIIFMTMIKIGRDPNAY